MNVQIITIDKEEEINNIFEKIDRSYVVDKPKILYKLYPNREDIDFYEIIQIDNKSTKRIALIDIKTEKQVVSFDVTSKYNTKYKEMFNKLYCTELLDKFPFYVYNSRYKTYFSPLSYKLKYDQLDTRHKFFRMKNYNNISFTRVINDFKKNYYNEYKSFLENNYWARQCFISFLVYHNKINYFANMKKYKWIFDQTPEFYLYKIKLINIIKENHCSYDYVFYKKIKGYELKDDVIISCNEEFLETTQNPNQIFRNHSFAYYEENCKKCVYLSRTRKDIRRYGHIYGSLNSTQEIIKLLNKEPGHIRLMNMINLYSGLKNKGYNPIPVDFVARLFHIDSIVNTTNLSEKDILMDYKYKLFKIFETIDKKMSSRTYDDFKRKIISKVITHYNDIYNVKKKRDLKILNLLQKMAIEDI